MINFNTDLADERRDIYRKANKIEKDIPGIETEERDVTQDIKVSTVKIINEEGANAIGKPVGTYITIDVKKLKLAGEVEIQKASEVVTEELTNNGKVQLVGFGTFDVAERAAREGRNPQTGATVKIAACKSAKFKAATALKEAIN